MRILNSTVLLGFCLLAACGPFAVVWPQGKCIGGSVQGTWPCDKVEMLAHIPNASTGGMNANDLWGWTDPLDGREYVLLGKRDGTWFIDISNPGLPRIVGELPTSGMANSLWRDIKVAGHHMVVVSEVVNSRLQVFDLTRLRDHTSMANPVTFTADTVLAGFSRAHNLAVHSEDSLVLVCGPSGADGILLYDFSQPTHPELVGSWSESYVHDAQVVTYAGPDEEHQGKRLAFATCEDLVRVLDVSDPSDIVELSAVEITPSDYLHQGWLTQGMTHFLVGDEGDETGGLVDETHTYALDMSDLDQPIWSSAHGLGSEATDHNLYIRGNWVHQSNYADGLRLFRWSTDPEETLEAIGYFDTSPGTSGPGFSGSWSNYPFFESGTVAVADQQNGLFLLRTNVVRMWPEFPSVCPVDTLNLLVTVDSVVTAPLALRIPDGVDWMSVDTLPGPGTWPVSFAGLNWSGMQGMTLTMESEGVVHAYRVFVNVSDQAMHFPDADGDGYGTFDGAVMGCSPGPGYAHTGGDCNDGDADIRPGVMDVCDGTDNDCDQAIDEDGQSIPFYLDLDGDGIPGSQVFEACSPPPFGFFVEGADCNDFDATMYPGAPPTLLGLDNDCNGYVLGLEQLDGGCPGDLTGDDTVSIGDLLGFLNLFGTSGFFEADLNFDQHVGVADLLLLLSFLGNSC